jgi:hypothetical protein
MERKLSSNIPARSTASRRAVAQMKTLHRCVTSDSNVTSPSEGQISMYSLPACASSPKTSAFG